MVVKMVVMERPGNAGGTIVPRGEPRAAWSFAFGVVSIVVLPVGVIMGPLALMIGIGALRRIRNGAGLLTGVDCAVTGVVLGAVVTGLYMAVVGAEVASILLFGSPIPAAS